MSTEPDPDPRVVDPDPRVVEPVETTSDSRVDDPDPRVVEPVETTSDSRVVEPVETTSDPDARVRDRDPRVVEPVETTPPDPDHDDSGLDLARSVARSLARPGARRRTASGSALRPPTRRVDPRASGAHPDERDPQLLDSTITRLVAEQGWDTDVRVHGVFTRWEAIVGPEVAQHCSPEAFAEGKLVVRTDSTAWATQMKLLAHTVVRRLNEELGDGTVSVIDVLGPHGPTWKRGLRSVRDGRGPRDTYG